MIDVLIGSSAAGLGLGIARGSSIIPQFGSTEGLEREQELVDEMRARMNFHSAVEVRETPLKGKFEFSAFGCSLFSNGTVVVPEVGDKMWDIFTKSSLPFVYAHELAHIEGNDVLILPIVLVVSMVAIAIILSTAISFPPLLLLASELLSFVPFFYASKMIERRADLRAAEVCTDSEIAAAVWDFECDRLTNIYYRRESEHQPFFTRIWNQLTICENGDDLLDVAHPRVSERVKYLKESIRDQEVRKRLDQGLKDLEISIFEPTAQGA